MNTSRQDIQKLRIQVTRVKLTFNEFAQLWTGWWGSVDEIRSLKNVCCYFTFSPAALVAT